MLDKNTNTNKVSNAGGHIFSKYMHGYMRFLIVKINAFSCILNGACIAVPVLPIGIDKLDHCLHYNLTI